MIARKKRARNLKGGNEARGQVRGRLKSSGLSSLPLLQFPASRLSPRRAHLSFSIAASLILSLRSPSNAHARAHIFPRFVNFIYCFFSPLYHSHRLMLHNFIHSLSLSLSFYHSIFLFLGNKLPCLTNIRPRIRTLYSYPRLFFPPLFSFTISSHPDNPTPLLLFPRLIGRVLFPFYFSFHRDISECNTTRTSLLIPLMAYILVYRLCSACSFVASIA